MSWQHKSSWLCAFLVMLCVAAGTSAVAAEMPADEAWKALPKYEHGQDMAALLAMDRVVIQAMASPQSRAACAARLGALLQAADTTPAARQYICMQLRQVGTAAQVLLLAGLLAKPETSDMARQALEAIPGEESLSVLRNSLGTLRGTLLVGAINSVAARKDARSVAKLQELADGKDGPVAAAALWALGNIADEQAAGFLMARAEKAATPTPENLAAPLLRCADAMVAAGDADRARAVYARLSQAGQPSNVRRAALEGLVRLQGKQATATILAWFAGKDADQRQVAAGHLRSLSGKQFDELAGRLDQLPPDSSFILIELVAARRRQSVLPLVLSAARSDKPDLKLAGLRSLGLLGDTSAIPLLTDSLAAGGQLTEAAQQALCRLPRKEVSAAMLAALKDRPKIRPAAIEVLKKLRCFEAIDALVALAAEEDPSVYEPALDGLRGITDPDDFDIPRLVKLLIATPRGPHRDEVEKTIAIVCGKLPAGADRAQVVLKALAKVDASQSPKYLPLLGRLGGAKVLKMVESAMGSSDAEVKQAAVRALCNWPNAEVADKLWDLAGQRDNSEFRQWALHAYVRVVSLKSDRPEAQTLAMLQKAMQRAETAEEKQWVLTRTATVRTMDAVLWLAGYLDDANLAQAACHSLVELAHHRFLRHPNMNRFGPILDKVSQVSKDPQVVERAKKYRLGL